MTNLFTSTKSKSQKNANNSATRGFCTKCLKAKSTCLCHLLKPTNSSVKFVFLMHPKERRHRSGTGTGRLTHLCISNSEIIEGVEFFQNQKIQTFLSLPEFYPCVLFPSEKALSLNSLEHTELLKLKLKNKTLLVFVIDASWSCAKTIVRKNEFLHELPHISFSAPKKSQFLFKKQPQEYCLSTLESVAEMLKLVKENKVTIESSNFLQLHLLELFRLFVSQQASCSVNSSD